jgi:uncharacterized phage protein (TIGR01671 family)
MESRYLYRGKRIDNGKWVEGDLVHSVYKINDVCVGQYGNEVGMHEVDPLTVCQCTGLKDKNGRLIFENDIVWDSDERAFYEIIWNQEDMCWNVEDADGHKSEFEECYGSTIEVNGNRFDNPELFGVNCFQNGNS